MVIQEARYDSLSSLGHESDSAYNSAKEPSPTHGLTVLDSVRGESVSLRTRLPKLPQELRDLIWGYYWAPGPNDAYLGRSSTIWKVIGTLRSLSRHPVPACSHPQRCTCFTLEQLPSVVLPAYVGNSAAHDATLAAMRIIQESQWLFLPQVYTVCFERISEWLFHDVLHVGVSFAHALCQVILDYGPDFQSVPVEAVAQRSHALRVLKQHFEMLLQIPTGAGLEITLMFEHVKDVLVDKIVGVVKTLEALQDVWMELKGRGVQFVVWLLKPVGPFKERAGVQEYYDMTLKDWQDDPKTKDIPAPAWCH